MSMKAVYIEQPGDLDALTYGEQPIPSIGPKQVLVKVIKTSINYIDTYHRTGLYKLPLPAILGRDGAGIVEKVGDDVTYVKAGDRVAFVAGGSYAEYVPVAESKLVKIDDEITYDDAVCMMLQGLTAHYLTVDTYPYKPGDWVLIHAGAGGTGSLAIQIAKAVGLNVIATVGSDEKVEIVKKFNPDHIINYNKEDIYEKVMAVTNNVGVHFVLDGVGKSTYEVSMKCAKKRGYVILFGNASGPVPPIDPLSLTSHGSIFISRPTLVDYILSHEDFLKRSNDLMQWVKEKKLVFSVGATFDLTDMKKAHELIESRGSTGKIVINVQNE